MVIPSEFEAGNLVDRKAVMAAFLDVDVEDREALPREPFGALRLQPCQHLTLGNREPLDDRRELADPCTRGEHQPSCFVAPSIRRHHDALTAVMRVPTEHAFA